MKNRSLARRLNSHCPDIQDESVMTTTPIDMGKSTWLAHLPEAALLVDIDQDLITDANPAASWLLGHTCPELVAVPCTHLFRDQRARLITFTEETLARGKAWSCDFSIHHLDGHLIELELTASLVGDASARCLLLILRDRRQLRSLRERHEVNRYHSGGLLEWRRVAELFNDMERENQLILHAVGEGIYGVDAEGRTTFVNPAAERMLGWQGEELMGRVIHRVVHHSHEDGSIFPLKDCPIYSAFRDASVRRIGQDWFWRRDGTGFPVEYTSTPIMDNGHPVGAVVVFRDISQRRKTEDELRVALAEVESLKRRLELENAYLQEELSAEHHFHEILGRSDATKSIVRKIGLVAPTDANVLISGESGTGKELIARAIHQSSTRRDRPLIRVNCAAIPKDLFESEFFGHIKGAFTGAVNNRIGRFELADGGTLFLDEVGEIPLELQGKLLRVLQEQQFERVGENTTRHVDVRVIAATNRDLPDEIRDKRFREDLYFRLNVFPIESVPLRQRIEDIPLLAQEFLRRTCQRFKRTMLTLRLGDVERLQQYHWPGNVRELENVIERQVITAGSHLEFDLPASRTSLDPEHPDDKLQTMKVSGHAQRPILTEAELRQLEIDNLMRTLRRTRGQVFGEAGAARILGIKPTTLVSRMKKLGLSSSGDGFVI